jgi:hypothetical protein
VKTYRLPTVLIALIGYTPLFAQHECCGGGNSAIPGMPTMDTPGDAVASLEGLGDAASCDATTDTSRIVTSTFGYFG